MEDSGPTSDKNWFVLTTILLVNGDELNSAKVFSSSFLFFFFFFHRAFGTSKNKYCYMKIVNNFSMQCFHCRTLSV